MVYTGGKYVYYLLESFFQSCPLSPIIFRITAYLMILAINTLEIAIGEEYVANAFVA